MTLVMLLLVKNEADIIRFNLDYHPEAGVDHIVVTDNGSSDGTRDILSDYAKLAQVTVLDEQGDDFSQGRWVTRMAQLAGRELDAEWVISNDADEFWCLNDKRLKQRLGNTDADMLACPRRNMVYAHDREDERPWFQRAVYRADPPLPKARRSGCAQ